jgi:hypothetical protein
VDGDGLLGLVEFTAVMQMAEGGCQVGWLLLALPRDSKDAA